MSRREVEGVNSERSGWSRGSQQAAKQTAMHLRCPPPAPQPRPRPGSRFPRFPPPPAEPGLPPPGPRGAGRSALRRLPRPAPLNRSDAVPHFLSPTPSRGKGEHSPAPPGPGSGGSFWRSRLEGGGHVSGLPTPGSSGTLPHAPAYAAPAQPRLPTGKHPKKGQKSKFGVNLASGEERRVRWGRGGCAGPSAERGRGRVTREAAGLQSEDGGRGGRGGVPGGVRAGGARVPPGCSRVETMRGTWGRGRQGAQLGSRLQGDGRGGALALGAEAGRGSQGRRGQARPAAPKSSGVPPLPRFPQVPGEALP